MPRRTAGYPCRFSTSVKSLVKEHSNVISLHGYGSDDKKIKIGGTDRERAELLTSVPPIFIFLSSLP
jgi:hypothetical protein